jgi:hypothetical protein
MPAAPETPESSSGSSLRISLTADDAGAQDVRQLIQWLQQDPELAAEPAKSQLRLEWRQRPPGPDESMGPVEDILVWLASSPAPPLIFGLLRSLHNHIRNRGDRTTEVTVVVTDDLELTLRAGEPQSRAELEEKARRAADALRQDDDPE